jgi:hypothetical protein
MNDMHNVNVVKEADIAGIIAEELSNKDRPSLTSPYDMMFLVIELCTSILFDAGVHRNEKLRFFEFFERKIQQVVWR